MIASISSEWISHPCWEIRSPASLVPGVNVIVPVRRR
jgi:hypothetical protein